MTSFSVFNFFSLLGGLALFLYGMQQGEKNIRRIGGNQLRKIIEAITKHRFFSYLAGLITTLITQSSSATTVILVGLVNAKIMTLGQSLGMILGSDLGTTITVQLFAFKFHQIAPLLIAGGYFCTLSRRNEKFVSYGKLLLAVGLIFFGMGIMSNAVKPLHKLPQFEAALHASLTNPFLGLLAGTIITGIIQSSAATLTIVIALVTSLHEHGNTAVPLHALFPLVMGANLGTCVTAFLSTVRVGISGTRVAWSHFLFKLFGIVIMVPLIPFINSLTPFFPRSPALQIAMLHTLFNAVISIAFLPALHPFEQLIEKMIRSKTAAKDEYRLEYLSSAVISLPVLALAQAVKEISRMADKVRHMIGDSFELIEQFSLQKKASIAHSDNEVDFLHEQIVTFLTRMSREELDNESATYVYELIMVTTDLEHIGDSVSKTIINLAEKIDKSPIPLSPEGKAEILDFFRQTITDLSEVLAAFTMNNHELARNIYNRKKERDARYDQLFSRHMDRLFNRKPESLQTTSIHIDLLEEIRRIDHFVFRISAHLLKIHNAE